MGRQRNVNRMGVSRLRIYFALSFNMSTFKFVIVIPTNVGVATSDYILYIRQRNQLLRNSSSFTLSYFVFCYYVV
jgi:hypothetical protein